MLRPYVPLGTKKKGEGEGEEVVSGQPYGHSSDWWSLGILMYVMLVGKVGFQRIFYICYVGRKGWYSEDLLCMLFWSERLVFRRFIMYVMLVRKVGIQKIYYVCYVGQKGWYSEDLLCMLCWFG